MKLPAMLFLLLVIVSGIPIVSFSQDSIRLKKIGAISPKYYEELSTDVKKINTRLGRKTRKWLMKAYREEQRLFKKVYKRDSLTAKRLFPNISGKIDLQRLCTSQTLRETVLAPAYIGKFDSVLTAFSFLRENKVLSQAASLQVSSSIEAIGELRSTLGIANYVDKYLDFRKSFLREQLQRFSLKKELDRLSKQVGYYHQQIQQYKDLLNDPEKLAHRMLLTVSQIKTFQDFFNKHSELAGLFRLPGIADQPGQALTGLQTRAAITQELENRFGNDPGTLQTVQGNIKNAHNELNKKRDKQEEDRGTDEARTRKINKQRTKTFWDRLEAGINIQSRRSNVFLPVTSDLGFSLGYKLDDTRQLGIGLSYKIGWGSGLKNIMITHQGISVRSFLDWKLHKDLLLTGGFEMNYLAEFKRLDELKDMKSWQESCLIGLTKISMLNSAMLKKTRLQLLWDVLSYRQVPKANPFVFRIGYVWR